jgi:hypothetical protein
MDNYCECGKRIPEGDVLCDECAWKYAQPQTVIESEFEKLYDLIKEKSDG